MFKRNQVMITALAIMIAVAGYLNFAGTKVGEEELADVGASAGQESDMEALLELSDEDGKEDIAVADCHVCSIGTVHTEISDEKRVVGRDGTFSHYSSDYRDVCFFYYLTEDFVGTGDYNSAAGEE